MADEKPGETQPWVQSGWRRRWETRAAGESNYRCGKQMQPGVKACPDQRLVISKKPSLDLTEGSVLSPVLTRMMPPPSSSLRRPS